MNQKRKGREPLPKITPGKVAEHLRTITRHRRLVMKGCFRIGLYAQGLTHDLSKYAPVEFWRGARYYQGTRSPNDIERKKTGVSQAWLHHKGRNRPISNTGWITCSFRRAGSPLPGIPCPCAM